jgi:hypothetical protein
MTAVASPPSDTLVSQPSREVLFFSRRDKLILVHTPEYPVFGAQGQPTSMKTEGVRIEFRDGMLRVPLEGTVRTGQGRQFPAADLLKWLEEHPLLGDSYEGFSKLAQVAPPVSEEEQERITEAATVHDVDTLRQILDAEAAGWNRGAIVNVVRRRLEQIEQLRAQMETQLAAEAGEKAAAKKAAR